MVTYEKDGIERWRGRWTQEFLILKGQPAVHFTQRGDGRYSPFPGQVAWKTESYWEAGRNFRPLQYERKVEDSEGKLIFHERQNFDWAAGKVFLEKLKPGDLKNSYAQELTVPEDTLTADGLPTYLRALLYDSRRRAGASLLTDEPRVRGVEFRVEGIQRIQTSAGEFECYRIKMDVRLGLLSLFRFLVPEIRFWFAKEPPHHWVRYQGLEAGRGSPEVIRALVRFAGPDLRVP